RIVGLVALVEHLVKEAVCLIVQPGALLYDRLAFAAQALPRLTRAVLVVTRHACRAALAAEVDAQSHPPIEGIAAGVPYIVGDEPGSNAPSSWYAVRVWSCSKARTVGGSPDRPSSDQRAAGWS